MKRLIIASAVAALVGCSTTSVPLNTVTSPTPAVTKDQTISAAGKVDSPLTIDLPSWYIKPPASTDDYIWFAGTGYSSDLAMSREKALLDSQMKMADTLNGVLNAMVKQQKSDNAGSVVTDKTSVTVKKIIANTVMTGHRIEDARVVSENRSYRTFILVRYPVGDANRLLKAQQQQKSQNNDSDEALQRELDREIQPQAKSSPVSQVAPAPVVVAPAPVVAPVAQATSAVTTVNLLPVDNEEYKARRDAALQKPGAVIGQVTIR
jgi:hypothetical protein